MKWILVQIFISFFMISNTSCDVKMRGVKMITREEAIELASSEAQRLGYVIEKMDSAIASTSYDVFGFIKSYPAYKNNALIIKELEGHHFWAVYFSPKQNMGIVLGGDLWIFVNSQSGGVLAVIRGK